ncbi:MAG: endolytic transglycosylase MltG [Rubrivivax sp.]|nr:endolytic transglycosylase MltG [Rubrivivax sp.]
MLLRAAIWSTVAVLVAAAAAAVTVWLWLERPLPLAAERVELSVEPGSNPRAVAQAWVDAGVMVPPRWLYEWFRWSGQARSIRAGSYEIHAGATPRSLLDKMVRGDETLEQVRFIEGWTLRQLRAELARAPHLRPASAALSDAELMAALGAPGVPAEGRFFPDTYAYSRGVSDLTVLRRAHRTMQRHLDAVWAERAPDSPLKSPDEVLILASIIEKETGRPEERGLVAGVFVNRLRIGMLLQTDPTVIYGLGEAFDGNLRKRDLLADGPYNTYTRGGLPPTPIALPGLASLRAAVQPQPTRALYFVARGDGSSHFSETLAEHNRAVNRYQRGGR